MLPVQLEGFVMKRFVLVFLISCCFSSSVFAQSTAVNAKKPVGPKLWIDSKTIDLGLIPVGTQKIEGVIAYMNDGDEALELTNINGPCDCFLGFTGDKILTPGNGGELFVNFDKNRIESGPVKRLVTFNTNDPANRLVRVAFSFEIERTDSSQQFKCSDKNPKIKIFSPPQTPT